MHIPETIESPGRHRALGILFTLFMVPALANGLYNPLLTDHAALFWSLDFFIFVPYPLAIYCIARRKNLIRPLEPGLDNTIAGKRNTPLVLLLCLILAPVFHYLLLAAWDLSSLFLPDHAFIKFSYSAMIPAEPPLRLVAVTYLALSAGIVEEVFYRGMLHKLLAGRYGLWPYLLISSLLFASIHWEQGLVGLSATFFYGLFCAMFYAKARNLWPLICAHTFVDIMAFS